MWNNSYLMMLVRELVKSEPSSQTNISHNEMGMQMTQKIS